MDWKKIFKENVLSGTNLLEIGTFITASVITGSLSPSNGSVALIPLFATMAIVFFLNKECSQMTSIEQRLGCSFMMSWLTAFKSVALLLPLAIIIMFVVWIGENF